VAVVLCRGESSVKLGDLEEQFAANVASFDHPMRKRSILERKLMDGRYVDQSSVKLLTYKSFPLALLSVPHPGCSFPPTVRQPKAIAD
jgi:hypothetical protein